VLVLARKKFEEKEFVFSGKTEVAGDDIARFQGSVGDSQRKANGSKDSRRGKKKVKDQRTCHHQFVVKGGKD